MVYVKIWDDPITFIVEGRGEFPLDMLRHSMAWPTGTDDAAKMLLTCRRRVSVTAYLTRHVNPKRWESFGWRVIDADLFPYLQAGLIEKEDAAA